MSQIPPLSFYEFFAGGGMARIGLGEAWRCEFANDFDPVKAKAYGANFEDAGDHFQCGDVWAVEPSALPGRADLAWASSPCQDFSLAGERAGLAGGRSSAFYGFWRLIEALDGEGRAPRAIVVENVAGLLTSNGGADLAAVLAAMASRGYRFGVLEIDAAAVLPQSRVRVFIVAARGAPAALQGPSLHHTRAVRAAFERLPPALKAQWVWWGLAAPGRRNLDLADLLEPDGAVTWRTTAQTDRLIALMDAVNRAKLTQAIEAGDRRVGAVFRRVRQGVQRAEVRYDGLAGCLRTPRGGSSRQLLIISEAGQVRTRLVSAREGARLMGLADDYALPRSATAALHVIGDGVAVPVVRRLSEELLIPLLTTPASAYAAE
ncbi:DNA cytosine methyltransferase [soil metagenome]